MPLRSEHALVLVGRGAGAVCMSCWVAPAMGKSEETPPMLAEPGMFKGLSLLASSTNLANKLPPYSTYFRGYDVYNYDLVGRTIFVRLRLQT